MIVVENIKYSRSPTNIGGARNTGVVVEKQGQKTLEKPRNTQFPDP